MSIESFDVLNKKIKIAFDFDGVCTDLSCINDQTINEFELLYSPFSISTSKPRKGILELVSIFGLFADLIIVTSRPVGDEKYIKNWLSNHQMLSFFQNIYCCSDTSKSKMMEEHGIALLIDDKPNQIEDLTDNLNGILWGNQTWIELTSEIFSFLISTSRAFLKIESELKLIDVQYLTNCGSSQVFILEFVDNIKLKLRVCLDYEVKQRIMYFLEITKKNNYSHVSTLVTQNGLAIIKYFIEGELISSYSESERLHYIYKAGLALAKLHSITIEKSISDLRFDLNETNESLLVFSADNHNMIISAENEVVFIDLEACISGSRWIDVLWSENLLCENEQERKAFAEGYFTIYKGNMPTAEEAKIAKLNYKLWLTYQLKNSKHTHSNDLDRLEIINNIFSRLWNSKSLCV